VHAARAQSCGSGFQPASCWTGLQPVALRRRFAAAAAIVLSCVATPLLAQPSIPDAVIERWERHWTLQVDGAVVYHDTRHVRLNTDRAHRRFANVRIPYNAAHEAVEVRVARTRRPDGGYVEVPDYSKTEVSPRAAAGWPAFADVRERVLVMSGVEPGSVVEVEYQRRSDTGFRRWVADDLRIDDEYPVKTHTIAIELPRGAALSPIVSGLPESAYLYELTQSTDGSALHQWVFADLPASVDEPRAPSWRERGVRLCFTTAPDAETWLRDRLERVDGAADDSPLIAKLAERWTKETAGIRGLQAGLSKEFNFVDFDDDRRPAALRPAPRTLESNYGLPAEACAGLLSLARVAGVAARPAVLVSDEAYSELAPTDEAIAAFVLLAGDGAEAEIWHPQRGRVTRDQRWAGHTVLSLSDAGLAARRLPAWEDARESRCTARGAVAMAEDGKLSGKIEIACSGMFADGEDLRTRERQSERVNALVRRLLPGVSVKQFDVRSLTPTTFEFEAQLETSKPLEKLSGAHRLELGAEGPACAEIELPLDHAKRQTPVRIAGAFEERVELTLSWPAKWTLDAAPIEVAAASGEWGSVRQSCVVGEGECKLTREVRVDQRDLPASAFLAVRAPLNGLRSAAARTLIVKKAE